MATASRLFYLESRILFAVLNYGSEGKKTTTQPSFKHFSGCTEFSFYDIVCKIKILKIDFHQPHLGWGTKWHIIPYIFSRTFSTEFWPPFGYLTKYFDTWIMVMMGTKWSLIRAQNRWVSKSKMKLCDPLWHPFLALINKKNKNNKIK